MQKYAFRKIISFVKLAVFLKQGKAKCDILLQLRYVPLTARRDRNEDFLSFHGNMDSAIQMEKPTNQIKSNSHLRWLQSYVVKGAHPKRWHVMTAELRS